MRITGAHYLLYSNDPDADRAFFRDVLNFRSVDLGHNWLISPCRPRRWRYIQAISRNIMPIIACSARCST